MLELRVQQVRVSGIEASLGTDPKAITPNPRLPWLSLLIGLAAFSAFSGFKALWPTDLYWVMSSWDLPTQYLGWKFFREAPWLQWPIGSIPLYGYDAPGSIVLTDSIPLLALLFKPLSPWLPADFQYFGIWALACFLLQAWFGCKLLQRFSTSALFCLGGSFFFATASVYVLRIFLHPALAGQWLLLAGMLLHLSPRFRGARWIGLLTVAVLVHAYLFVMVAAIWSADLVQRIYRREISISATGKNVAMAVTVVIAAMWTAGYFVPIVMVGTQVRTQANLLFPFWNGLNAYGGSWSWLVPAFKVEATTGDGFGYFGMGFLLLWACALLLSLRKAVSLPHRIPASTWITLTLVCGVLLICSFGTTLYAGEKALFSYALPAWLDRIYGVFRGAGRLIWPFWYLLLFWSLYQVATRLPARRAGLLVVALALVQCVDFTKPAMDYRRNFAATGPWALELVSPAWSSLEGRYGHIAFIMLDENADTKWTHPFIMSMQPAYRQVASVAAKHGMGINEAYLARFDEAKGIANRERRIKQLVQGQFEPDTLYAVTDVGLQQRAGCVAPDQVWIGQLDGIRLIVPGGESIPTLAAIPEEPCPQR